MAAPDPSLIVVDPPPLNTTDYPYAIQPFPAADLRDITGLIHTVAFGPEVPAPVNPARYEA